NCTASWVPRALDIPLGRALPRDATLTAVTLGDTAWVTIPGELQTALGHEVKRRSAPRFANTFVAGVSNDYLGYFLTEEDYEQVAYVTCASLFGPTAGSCLAETAIALLHRLGVSAGPPPPTPHCPQPPHDAR
ncbi:MAG TPA: hypothetical protein VFX28_12490, partial [Methylomirabilota bacterium]|nr:hypothetical protein [Methylomirabilota bacterium]